MVCGWQSEKCGVVGVGTGGYTQEAEGRPGSWPSGVTFAEYKPCDPSWCGRVATLEKSYESLCELAAARRGPTGGVPAQLWRFLWEVGEARPGCGNSSTSARRKRPGPDRRPRRQQAHRPAGQGMSGRLGPLKLTLEQGQQLVAGPPWGRPSGRPAPPSSSPVGAAENGGEGLGWQLMGASLYQFQADANDMEAWLVERCAWCPALS